MNEDPSSTDQHAIINRQLRRLRVLTIVSLSFSGLILFLILLGAIFHHHHRCHGYCGGRDFGRDGFHGGFHHHHFMDRGDWGHGGGFHHFGGARFDDRDRGPDSDDQGPPRKDDSGFVPQGGIGVGGFGGDKGPGQPHPGMGMMHPADPAKLTDGILAHLTQQLTLSDDQKARIKPIISQGIAQFQKDMEERKQAMQKQIEDAKAKIKPILNADQQKQFDEMPMPGQKPAEPADK